MGLSEVEELQQRCSELEELYGEAVKARDEAIDERNKATVLIALQLQSETEELNARIVDLLNENRKLREENEDLGIRLEYAKDDLTKLQQRHIGLQLEQEQWMKEKEQLWAKMGQVQKTQEKEGTASNSHRKEASAMLDKHEDPAYRHVKHDLLASASEDLELEPRPPVTPKLSKPEDVFDVHEELGKGKFGVVKRVVEKSTQRVFAAKYVRLSSSGGGSSRDDIMREINIMNQLHHKRLVGLIDAFDVSNNIIMVMEFVSGGELFERVADADCLTEREASYYMYQLLQGLKYMHSKNIVHLDLKPENIVCVSKDSWDVKLIDFGLAQELKTGVKMKALKGTPEFMAPEAVNFDTISLATDMWSVGVIAYILLSGLSPLLGDDNNETLANVTAAEWDFDDESFDVISDEAKDFISNLLVKNSRKRNTVDESLKHDWMEKSASAGAVKINTKKLKQFLAKRRWQKSVNALVAVRRLSNFTSLINLKTTASETASLASMPSVGEEEEEEEVDFDTEEENHSGTVREPFGEEMTGSHKLKEGHSEKKGESKFNKPLETDIKQDGKPASMHIDSPVFIKMLGDASVSEGGSVSLEVVLDQNSNYDLEWFKNGEKLAQTGRVSLVNHSEGRHEVIIRDTKEDDAGEISCVAGNEAGKVTCSGNLKIEVLSKSDNSDEDADAADSCIKVPVFTKELTDVTANEHDTITLEVAVNGDSPCELEWFKNAVDVTENERISLISNGNGRFSLVIRDCEDDDTGEYCCVAQNEAGRVTCAGWLTVEVDSGKSDEEETEESEDEEDEIVRKELVEIRDGDVQTYYCIEEEIGRGRFGIVKKCVELDTATRFCAKFIKARPSQKAEFKREIDVMNALHHPRLIRLYDAFEEPRQIILIMEYARGGDLFARIDGDSLPECETVKILRQVLDGVKFMHDNKFMHLDLKPQNVMFKNEGGSRIKLIDFSLTRKFDPQLETKISFGTAEYVAPEIVNYEPVTFAADMWAIGVIAYIMLSGDSPFLCSSEAETFTRITEARWQFTDVFDYVSKEAKDFIGRLLLKNPKQRMTADECLHHDWLQPPGFSGKQESKNHSEGELAMDENFNIVSPTAKKRQESEQIEEHETTLDSHKLEANLRVLLTKFQMEKKAREELEEQLREEVERAETLEDELRDSGMSRKKLEESISKLEKEIVDLKKKATTNSEVLKRVAESEGEKRGLEDLLAERTKSLNTLTQKYDSLKEKVESYDVLEERVYSLERERKELRETKQLLVGKIEDVEKEMELLLDKNEKNALVRAEFENEILKLKEEKDSFESKYTSLHKEKDSLVEKLTKQLSAMDEQKKSLTHEKVNLEAKLEAVKTENEEMKAKLLELERLKETMNNGKDEKDKEERETLATIKKQKEEAQRTCEDLTSKLSKAYADLETARSQENDNTNIVSFQEEITVLQEKLSSHQQTKDQLKKFVDEKEAEIEKLNNKIQQLEMDNKRLNEERNKQSEDYKSKLDKANETIAELRRTESKRRSETDVNGAGESDESAVQTLKTEVCSLKEKLAMANKELEEKVKSEHQANSSVLEDKVVVKSAGQLENESSFSFEMEERESEAKESRQEIKTSCQETSLKMRSREDVTESADSQMSRMLELSGNVNDGSLKQNFEDLKMLAQGLESKLNWEVQKTKSLEDELENLKIEKKRGITMYKELEAECERLTKELDDIECSQSEVRLREKLRSRLRAQEEECHALAKQLDSVRKEVQLLKEERDSGNTMYVNLAEKCKNLLKENKQLEQEKHEGEQKAKQSQGLEESLQTRLHEMVEMKNEIEAMRNNLRSLVREKEEGKKEFTAVQNDYVKLASDCKELQKQIDQERHRGEYLAGERSLLQKKLEDVQKELNQKDLVASADKRTIETYVQENKILKDERGNQIKETERLRKESRELVHGVKELTKIKEELNDRLQEKGNLLKELENLKRENKILLKDREEINELEKAREDLRVAKLERENALKEVEMMEQKCDSVLKEHDELKNENEDLNVLKYENENAVKEIERLKQERELLLNDQNELRSLKEVLNVLEGEKEEAVQDLQVMKEENGYLQSKVEKLEEFKEESDACNSENDVALKEILKLKRDNESLLIQHREMERLKEELNSLQCEKEYGLKELRRLQEKNEVLTNNLEEIRNTKVAQNELLLSSTEENQRLMKKSNELQTNLETQVLETMRLKKENSSLKKKVEVLTKEIQRFQDEKNNRETRRFQLSKGLGRKDTEDKYKAMAAEVKSSKNEVEFLQKEVEDLTEEKNELIQAYNVLKKELVVLKEELCTLERCVQAKSTDLESLMQEKNFQENRNMELEKELKIISAEKEKLQNDLNNVTLDFETQTQRLDSAQKEILDITKENEEMHKSYIDLEEKYSRIRKINRELEEDIEVEISKLVEARARLDALNKENANLQNEIKNLQNEFDKKQALEEIGDHEHVRGELAKKVLYLEKKRAKDKAHKKELEVQLADEKSRNENFEKKKKKLEDQLKELGEELRKEDGVISSLEMQLNNLRPLKEQVNALEKEIEQLREKLDFETRDKHSKVEEIELRKKENDSLIYELETTRHRLVSNVLNPLEEGQISRSFRVNAADISAGKTKAWSCIKENITNLIRDCERLKAENSAIQQERSHLKEGNQATKTISANKEVKLSMAEQDDDKTETKEHSPKEALYKELEVLYQRIDEDEVKMKMMMNEKEELVFQLECMDRLGPTAGRDGGSLKSQKGLFSPVDETLRTNFHTEMKFQSLQTMERISIIERERGVTQESLDPNHQQHELLTPSRLHDSQHEQLVIARELVRRNRKIFELEQEIELLLSRNQPATNGKITDERHWTELEKGKLLRIESENKTIKDLSSEPIVAALQREITNLESENHCLRNEKEDLLMQNSAKDKKLELLEKRIKELTERKLYLVNRTDSGKRIEFNDTDKSLVTCDEELRAARHKVNELEAELEHLKNSNNSIRKRELDEMETKWAKRLRKECMELQAELLEKHNKDKQMWFNKEAELQNIIRQMKMVMDKKLTQAEIERRKLQQQLLSARNSSFHGSTINLDSNSDDSGEGPPPTPGASSDANAIDFLSDRELRRVAYKLSGEEWSQLGTFLGVGDKDLFQLGSLNMGPQEKAFRLLCMWRSTCRLGRTQMISQLAVSLEEVKRKDVAQFVLEQFMSGKPRKKLFGW